MTRLTSGFYLMWRTYYCHKFAWKLFYLYLNRIGRLCNHKFVYVCVTQILKVKNFCSKGWLRPCPTCPLSVLDSKRFPTLYLLIPSLPTSHPSSSCLASNARTLERGQRAKPGNSSLFSPLPSNRLLFISTASKPVSSPKLQSVFSWLFAP